MLDKGFRITTLWQESLKALLAFLGAASRAFYRGLGPTFKRIVQGPLTEPVFRSFGGDIIR